MCLQNQTSDKSNQSHSYLLSYYKLHAIDYRRGTRGIARSSLTQKHLRMPSARRWNRTTNPLMSTEPAFFVP